MIKIKTEKWIDPEKKIVESVSKRNEFEKSDRTVRLYITAVSLGSTIFLLLAGLLALSYYLSLLQFNNAYTFYKMTPYFFFLPLVLIFASVIAFQIYLRAKELTRRGLISSFFLPFIILACTIVAYIAGKEIVAYMDLGRTEHITFGNYFGIIFYEMLVLSGFMFFILFPLSGKFVKKERGISSDATWALMIFAAITVLPLGFYYGKTLVSFYEEPFAGAKEAQEMFGVPPVSFEFSGFPRDYELIKIEKEKEKRQIMLVYNNESDNMTSRILVSESQKDPIEGLTSFSYLKEGPVAGVKVQYFESSDEYLLYFLKDNLYITIQANKAAVSFEELEEIVETAK